MIRLDLKWQSEAKSDVNPDASASQSTDRILLNPVFSAHNNKDIEDLFEESKRAFKGIGCDIRMITISSGIDSCENTVSLLLNLSLTN